MAIDEEVTARSVSFDSSFLPNLDIAEREGEDCARRAVEKLSIEIGA